jgi:hypothetical protein
MISADLSQSINNTNLLIKHIKPKHTVNCQQHDYDNHKATKNRPLFLIAVVPTAVTMKVIDLCFVTWRTVDTFRVKFLLPSSGIHFYTNVSYLTVLFQLATECNRLEGIISISYSLSPGSNLDSLVHGFS